MKSDFPSFLPMLSVLVFIIAIQVIPYCTTEINCVIIEKCLKNSACKIKITESRTKNTAVKCMEESSDARLY